MVKVKTKKTMNFTDLVRWAWYKNKTDVTFYSDNGSYVCFDEYGDISMVYDIEKEDLFKVEIEEEVTEKTKIPQLLEIFSYIGRSVIGNKAKEACTYIYKSIVDEHRAESLAFYMIHPDGTTTLLWTKDGGMVE